MALIAGLLIGFAATTVAYRHRILMVPGPHTFLERLDRDLSLSPQQHHQIEDLIRETRSKMEKLHQDFRQQHQQLIMQAHDQIRAMLTPDQQLKFDHDFAHPGDSEHEHHHDD